MDAISRLSLPLDTQALTGARAAKALGAQSGVSSTQGSDGGGFGVAFKDALKSVSNAQNESTALQKEVQLDNPSVSLEQTMVSMQKAQIGFQATVHVRNRMVQAYTDIMNMQV